MQVRNCKWQKTVLHKYHITILKKTFLNVVIKLVYTSTNGSNGGSCKASPKSGGDMFSRLILCESLLKTLGVVSGGDV